MATQAEFEQAIKDAYKEMDVDKDGNISKPELKKLLVQIFGAKVPDAVVDHVMETADQDKSGNINTIDELVGALCSIEVMLIASELAAVFRQMDENKDGKLTKAEIEKGFAKCGQHGSHDKEIRDLINKADTDGDGKIDCEEFICFIMEEMLKA